MTLRQILMFDVNRMVRWDVGRALTRPVTNPLLKAACGYILGIAVFGLGGMMAGIVIGTAPSEGAVRLLALALGLLFAIMPNTPRRRENANTEAPPSSA